MSEQALDFRRSARIIRRHLILVGAVAALGLLVGVGYGLYKPPLKTASTLVVVPPAKGFSTANSSYIDTQLVIARSAPVLAAALPHAGAAMSLGALRDRVDVQALTANVISISAQATSSFQAMATVNAVTNSYLDYLGSAGSPVGKVAARPLGNATTAVGTAWPLHLVETGGIGLLAGVLAGAIIALAVGRGDRQLRERDQVANSIGVPVLASIPAEQPRDAAGWTELLERYQPRAIDAWHLRKALQQLGFAGTFAGRVGSTNGSAAGSAPTLAVLSLSSDRKALALGPQLAAFAAGMGIRTALVLGPQHGARIAATLHAACLAGPVMRSGNLLVATRDRTNTTEWPSDVALIVVVGVVDGDNPRVADTIPARVTVLSVSAGATTAEQLARVATNAAIDGRAITGVLLANPDAADQTTGRTPQVGRAPERRMPARDTRVATENRR